MKQLFILILFAIANTSFSYSPPDSCLKIYDIPEDETFTNPYDVRVDSCDGSSTFGEFYAKGYFSVKFDYNIIPRSGLFPEDTLIEYSISDIDTIYKDAIIDFQNLETQYGSFKFIEEKPHLPDTTTLLSRKLSINFDNFVNIESADKSIDSLEIVTSVGFAHGFRVLSNIETEDHNLSIYPNPAKEEIKINYDKMINSIEILDLNGKRVLSNQYLAPQMEQSLNIDYLQSGTYFIRINDKVYKRFVKE